MEKIFIDLPVTMDHFSGSNWVILREKEIMEEKLWKIFKNTNKWLEYSEKKNALLLTFIGIQLTLIRLFSNEVKGLSFLSFTILSICFILAIISFFPKTSIPKNTYNWGFPKNSINKNDNLIFYGDIAKYNAEQYISAMETYLNGEISNDKYLVDICTQIVINSEISLVKFIIFKAAIWLMGVGQLLFFVSLC